MINSISAKNICLNSQINRGKQNLSQNFSATEIPAQNNFVYPSAENFKAIAFGSLIPVDSGYNEQKLPEFVEVIDNKPQDNLIKFDAKERELYKKLGCSKFYELNKPATPEEEEQFCKKISLLAKEDLGTSINLPSKTYGAKFHIALIEQLQMFKELKHPMPNEVGSFRRPVIWNKDHTNFLAVRAHIYTFLKSIEFNDEAIEQSRQLNKPEQEIINNSISTFNHEMGHLAHYEKERKKFNESFELWLNEDERKTYKSFADLYKEHYDEINLTDKDKDKPPKDMFDLNVPFNIVKLNSNRQKIYQTLTNPVNETIFPKLKVEEMNNIVLKLCTKSTELDCLEKVKDRKAYAESFDEEIQEDPEYKDLLTYPYSKHDSCEAVAEGQRVETEGNPISKDYLLPLRPETRAVLKELGKPDCPTISYLPDDYFESKEK